MKKPFNYQLFYRRTALIIYDILSVTASSFLAILIRYDFQLNTVPVPALSQPVGVCRGDGAAESGNGVPDCQRGRRDRHQFFPDGDEGGAGQLLFSVFFLFAVLSFCKPLFLPVFPQQEA